MKRSAVEVEAQHYSQATLTLESEAARYCTLGPILTINCNEASVLSGFSERALFPIIVETRASIAYTLKALGMIVYREYQSLLAATSTEIPHVFLGAGMMERPESDILECIRAWCARVTPPVLLILAYPSYKDRNATQIASLIQQQIGGNFVISLGCFQNIPGMVIIRRRTSRLCHVRWEGSQDSEIDGSLALVNKEFCDRLLGVRPPLLISSTSARQIHSQAAIQESFTQSVLPPDILIRHSWPAAFGRSTARYTIHMQPWEYGALPTHWQAGLPHIDEIWSYTRYVAEIYAESGFPRERIHVMPLGYNQHIFTPEPGAADSALPLLPEGTCIFSFVGGLIRRKGCDLAVKAFCEAFTDKDQVCLVIKTSGADSFYARREELDVFGPLSTTPNVGRYIILDTYCSPADIAALYRRSAAVLCPFRGEGFGLPALEAMACGTPVLFSQGGAMDDFIPPELGYPIAAERRPLHKHFVDGVELIHDGWFLEPEVATIAKLMREVYENQQTARNKGLAAAQAVRNSCTWDHAAQKARRRLEHISSMLGFTGASINAKSRCTQEEINIKGTANGAGVHAMGEFD